MNPNGRSGTCVSIYDCQTIMSILHKFTINQEDYEFTKLSECQNGYGKAPYVCCSSDTGFARSEQDNDYANWRNYPKRTVLFPSTEGSFINKGSRSVNARPIITSLLPSPPSCGGVAIQNKIYGGSEAELNEFPWMVLLEYKRSMYHLYILFRK